MKGFRRVLARLSRLVSVNSIRMATRHVVDVAAGRVNHLKEKAARSKLMDTERTSAKASGSGRTIVASLAAAWKRRIGFHCCLPCFHSSLQTGAAGSSRFLQELGLPPGGIFSRSLLLLSEMASERSGHCKPICLARSVLCSQWLSC